MCSGNPIRQESKHTFVRGLKIATATYMHGVASGPTTPAEGSESRAHG